MVRLIRLLLGSSSSSSSSTTFTPRLRRFSATMLLCVISFLLLGFCSKGNAFSWSSLSSSISTTKNTIRNTTARRQKTKPSLVVNSKKNDAAEEEGYSSSNNDNENNINNNTNDDVVGDFFRNVGKFFGNPNVMKKLGEGSGQQSVVGNTRSATKDFSQHGVAGTLLLSLEATQIKVGALRLLLTLWFMGQQNFPQANTWKCNQSAEGDLDMYYVPDQSGALTIELTEEYGLRIYSLGTSTQQSNSFLLQQNVLLDNLLNELEHTVLNPSTSDADKPIKDSDKLLILKYPNAIQEARENLISFA